MLISLAYYTTKFEIYLQNNSPFPIVLLILFSESCDNIWDVDTTYAENELHYYSYTYTDDEIQIDKEQQEANNTDTVTSLGRVVSDAKKTFQSCVFIICVTWIQ